MPAPRFGERIPVRYHFTLDAWFTRRSTFTMRVWLLIADQVAEILQSTNGLYDFANGNVEVPYSIWPLGYTKMSLEVEFTSTADVYDLEQMKQQIYQLLFECGRPKVRTVFEVLDRDSTSEPSEA